MKQFGLIIITLLTLSCGTEKQYFQRSLTDMDKIYLNTNDSLIKKFSGKANWYRQYWTGNMLIRKDWKRYDIKQIGEWRQNSDDGTELWTIVNYDESGYLMDERILGDEGMPPTGETICRKELVGGQVRLVCDVTNRFRNGQIKEKGQRIITNNDKAKREGRWEYYTETGTLDKVIDYKNDKPVR